MQREHPGRSLRTTTSEKTTVHRIPTKMPFQAVFMRGGAGSACMDDFVVDQWNSDVERSSPRDFLWLHAMWTPFGHLMSCKIRPVISVACYFTTKSGGIGTGSVEWERLPILKQSLIQTPVQFSRDLYVVEIPGRMGICMPYVVYPINSSRVFGA
jgi:hypothetical protein